MISLCLFDLDNTLLRTQDLEGFRGQANVGNDGVVYRTRLAQAFDGNARRHLYTPAILDGLRRELPEMKWGVFTRAPRAYAQTLLARAYPNWRWDVVVAREDVTHTKPNPEGVLAAMHATGVTDASQVAVVGDEKSDVLAAYRAGAWSVVDRSVLTTQGSWAMERVPDAALRSATELGPVLRDIESYLPDLERRLASDAPVRAIHHRFDVINHQPPVGQGQKHEVTVLGKMFANYASLRARSDRHVLTRQILDHKDAVRFPDAWIQSLRAYLRRLVSTWGPRHQWVVTVIPKKPDGVPRMESLVVQLALSLQADPIPNLQCQFHPEVMAFSDGVARAHREHLTAARRFENVERHLSVVDAAAIQGRPVLVIDDVVTSGASLVCASRALTAAGASQVKCLALAKAVSDK